jgi:hypothetical protein
MLQQAQKNIPRDLDEGQHYTLLFVETAGRFSVISVPTALHQSLKHRRSTESL